jgi:hypothetical protein
VASLSAYPMSGPAIERMISRQMTMSSSSPPQ